MVLYTLLLGVPLLCGSVRGDIRILFPTANYTFFGLPDFAVVYNESGIPPYVDDLDQLSIDVLVGPNSNPVFLLGHTVDAHPPWNQNQQQVTRINPVASFSGVDLTNSYFLRFRSGLSQNRSVQITTYSNRFSILGLKLTRSPDFVALASADMGLPPPSRYFTCDLTEFKICPSEMALAGYTPTIKTATPSTSATTSLPSTTPFLAPSASVAGSSPSQSSSEQKVGSTASKSLIGGLAGGMGALFLFCCIVLLFCWRSRRNHKEQERTARKSFAPLFQPKWWGNWKKRHEQEARLSELPTEEASQNKQELASTAERNPML